MQHEVIPQKTLQMPGAKCFRIRVIGAPVAQLEQSVCLLSADPGSKGSIRYFRFSMFSIIWGICFSLKANLNALKTSDSGTVMAQRERLLLGLKVGNPGSTIELAGPRTSTSSLLKKDFERAVASTVRNYRPPKANKKKGSSLLRSSEWRAKTVFQQTAS